MIEALDGLSSSRCHAGRRAGANGDRERSAQDHAAGAPHTGARRPGERPAGVRRSERGAACGGRYRRFGRRPKRPWRGPDPARDTAGALDCYLEAHDCFTRAGNTEGAQLVRSVLESIGAHLMRDTTGMLEASNECSPERLTELIDKLRQAGRALRIGGSPEALASALRLRAHLIGNYYAPALLSWGENERTRDVLREEIALQRELGNREAEAIAVSSLGLALQRLGSLPEALASQREAEHAFRQLGNAQSVCNALGNQALILQRFGQVSEALRCAREGVQLAHERPGRPRSAAPRSDLVPRAGSRALTGAKPAVLGSFRSALSVTPSPAAPPPARSPAGPPAPWPPTRGTRSRAWRQRRCHRRPARARDRP